MTTNQTHTMTVPTTESNGHRAVLFDMDGVILEGYGTDPRVHMHALEDAVADLDLDVDPTAEPLAALDTYEYTDEFVAACELIGVDPVEFYALREKHSARRSIDRIRSGARGLYDDVDVLDDLAAERALALVSNNYDPTVSAVVDHFGFDAFSFVSGRDLGVDGFHRRKPEPYYLEHALRALGVADGVYVGDRKTDLVAAERAGLLPVFIRRAHNAELEPDHEAFVEIESLAEIPELL
jgi:N-acetyl-D-muramate 6-phosphate phosphatase